MHLSRGRRLLPIGGLLAFFLGTTAASAMEVKPLVVAHLSTRDGLPQGTVSATLQDSQGFVWLGTEDGLVRFDGHELHRYAYSQTAKNGLPGNFISSIVEDSGGDLWIGVKGAGLARWHRSSDTFTVYRHDPIDPHSLSSDAVHSLLVDSGGRLWIGTLNAGVDVLEPATGNIFHLRHDSVNVDSLVDDGVVTLTQDHAGRVWIGTKNGIDRWRFEGNSFRHEPRIADDHPALAGKKVTQIVEDMNGAVWVGTEEAGLYSMDSMGHVRSVFLHNATSTSIASNLILALSKDRAGRLWIGTADGLDLFDPAIRGFVHYRHDKEDRDSLSDSFVMSLYEDPSGLLWIGTKAGGVDRWNPHSWELGGNRPAWADGKMLTSFADAGNDRLWVGSVNGGLVRLDTATGEASTFDAIVKAPNALGDKRVMSLLLDHRGVLWVGTMAAGLKALAPNGQITSIPVAKGQPRSLSAAGIMTIFESRNGLLWIGTHGGGANVLDPTTGLIRQLPYGANIPGAVSAENVTSFVEDDHGNVWIGTEAGLNLATPDGAVIQVFHHNPSNSKTLSSDTVYSLARDSSGQVWVATDGGGLNRINGSTADPSNITFDSIFESDAVAGGPLYSVIADSSGSLWMSGNAGLTRYDLVSHDVRTYHREDGLQGEEFNSGAFYRTRDGRLCFGGTGGYNVFRPENLLSHASAPRVLLTRMDVLGVPESGATPYWLLHHVSLDYHANIVSFDFAALDFASPNRNRFEYKLAGLSDAWISLDTQRRLTLTNLAAGDYLLEVRASNAASVWSAKPLRLAIHKDAAPWKSPAAYSIYSMAGLLVLLVVAWLQRQKWQQSAAAQLRLESQVTSRTQQLREMNQRLLVANEAKSNFLARMSHELRTPMNGVLGMTELLERTPLTTVQARQTQTIRSSAQTLLQILNDLLDLSKVQAGKIELESLPIDLTQLSEECASLFAATAETKGLEIIVCPPIDDGYRLKGDPLRIRQILMNLIANAVKFTEVGEVVVSCKSELVESGMATVCISVADTGIGLSSEEIAKIFNPFTQADETTTRRFGGSGLGLAICAELAQLMGGTVSVVSQPGAGSSFTVTLPLQTESTDACEGPAPLTGCRVRIITRRSSLAESLSRYFTQMKPLSLVYGQQDLDGGPAEPELIVWDADSCGNALRTYLTRRDASSTPVIAVSTSVARDEFCLEQYLAEPRIVGKPVYREALLKAVESVFATPKALDAPAGSASLRVSHWNAHVLIVEDEAVNAAVAQGYLNELGCTSVWVTDGTHAIARSSIERFDLILMDLNMPGLDGFAATLQIRERHQAMHHIPIIALTATESGACREQCELAGMDDVLSKPYTFAQCEALLHRWTPRSTQDSLPPVDTSAPLYIDHQVVEAIRNIGNQNAGGLFGKLVRIFERSCVDSVDSIGKALVTDDFETARVICHKIKAAAANVGAVGLAGLMQELERACAARNSAQVQLLFERMAAAHLPLIEALRRLRRESYA